MRKAVVLDYAKYPFLVDVRKFIERRYARGVRLLDLLSLLESRILRRAEERVLNAIKEGDVGDPKGLPSEDEVLAFYIGLILVSTVNDKWLAKRYALAEAEKAHRFLEQDDDYVIEAVARMLGLDVKYLGSDGLRLPVRMRRGVVEYVVLPYAIHVSSYTRASRLMSDPSWKLVNQYVSKGYVYVTKRKAARLLKEVIAEKVEASVKPLDEVPPILEPLVERIKKVLMEERGALFEQAAYTFKPGEQQLPLGEVRVDAFPPCMARLYDALQRGENLSHHERFAITTFLIHVGMDLEEILNLFRRVPDFNERIARYQIEHLAGLRGSKKKYMPYSCETMRTLGLCMGDCKVKNPLVAYWRNVRKALRRGKKS